MATPASRNDKLRDGLAVILVGAFIAVIFILFWRSIPKENEQLIVYMLGQLSGFVAGVVAYHYVSKAGEKELDQARTENTGKLADAVLAAQAAPAPATTGPDASDAAQQVAHAAAAEADEISGENR